MKIRDSSPLSVIVLSGRLVMRCKKGYTAIFTLTLKCLHHGNIPFVNGFMFQLSPEQG